VLISGPDPDIVPGDRVGAGEPRGSGLAKIRPPVPDMADKVGELRPVEQLGDGLGVTVAGLRLQVRPARGFEFPLANLPLELELCLGVGDQLVDEAGVKRPISPDFSMIWEQNPGCNFSRRLRFSSLNSCLTPRQPATRSRTALRNAAMTSADFS